MFCTVIVSHQTDDIISIVKCEALRPHFLRRYDQNGFSVQLEEIRAFPHAPVLVPAAVQDADIIPVEAVLTGKERDSSAFVLHPDAGHSEKAVLFRVMPDLRVAEIFCITGLRDGVGGEDRILLIFFIIYAVSHSQALGLQTGRGIVFSL